MGNNQKETPKNSWIDKFVHLRNKMYAFKCGDDSKNNLKCFCKPQSRCIKLDEIKNCLDGNDYQKESDNLKIRSINHEMYFQKDSKNSLSSFDDKGYYESNIENKHWN